MIIARDDYVNMLYDQIGNGMVKVITGIRRCGKSYLLMNLFVKKLLDSGVPLDHIVTVSLDDEFNRDLRRPKALSAWLKSRLPNDSNPTFILIDEIQRCLPNEEDLKEGPCCLYFYDILNTYMKKPGVEVYVSGSNSHMLSKDIDTNFRGRSNEIRLWPLSFSEYHGFAKGDLGSDWNDFLSYGGMPLSVLAKSASEKVKYLKSVFQLVYTNDFVERYNLEASRYVLEAMLDVICSCEGSLTNPRRMAQTLKSEQNIRVDEMTIATYLERIADTFLFSMAKRWDVKGNRYLSTPVKLYTVDTGLRNARLNMRQIEESHLMESVIYNELLRRGYEVDVGVVDCVDKDSAGKSVRKRTEIDFVVNRGPQRIYIQSAQNVDDLEKRKQETLSLKKTGDYFRKLVITSGAGAPRVDTEGIMYTGVLYFLLHRDFLDSLGY